jgi:hypothetical protein
MQIYDRTCNPHKLLAKMLNLVYPMKATHQEQSQERHTNASPNSLLLIEFILEGIVFGAVRTEEVAEPLASRNMIIAHVWKTSVVLLLDSDSLSLTYRPSII